VEGLKRRLEIYELIFDSIHNGDHGDGRGRLCDSFQQTLRRFPRTRSCRSNRKTLHRSGGEFRMHIVAKTGVSEINQSHLIKARKWWSSVSRSRRRQGHRCVSARSCLRRSRRYQAREEALPPGIQSGTLRAGTDVDPFNRHTLESIVGDSEVIQSLRKEALKAAATQFPVLITGESGTGKSSLRRAFITRAPGGFTPLSRINCSPSQRPSRIRTLRLRERSVHRSTRRRQTGETRTRETRDRVPG